MTRAKSSATAAVSRAVLDRPANRWAWPGRNHRILLLAAVLTYFAVVVAVLTTSELVRLDWYVMRLKPFQRWPEPRHLLNAYVLAGQRGPSAIAAYAWLGLRAWRDKGPRRLRPVLMMSAALLLLNASVGAVKLGVGRLGPHYAHAPGSAEIFRGGEIFPSGHTANAVVVWGTLAYLALRHRRAAAVGSALVAFAVGLTAIYLGTHWVSDVLAGWAAGALVLLAVPLLEPLVAEVEQRILAWWRRRRAVRTPPASPGSWSAAPEGALIGCVECISTFFGRPTGVALERGPPPVAVARGR